jgi:hypothetical protein
MELRRYMERLVSVVSGTIEQEQPLGSESELVVTV